MPSSSSPKPPEPDLSTLCLFLRALADSHRLTIVQLLYRKGECSVSELCKELKQSQPAVSHHLNQLKEAGLVKFRRNGKYNYYHLQDEGMYRLLQTYAYNGSPLRFQLGDYEWQLHKR